jgi:GTPase KRas protein
MSEENFLKIVVLGSGGVGKSALTFRLITDNFVPEYDPTIEDDYRKAVEIDGQVERLDILDTAGQEEYNSMRDMWYQSGEGFLLIYSITNRSTFEESDEVYKEILMAKDPIPEGGVPVVLVGNKCDLEKERDVTMEEGQAMAKAWSEESGGTVPFFEASAKEKIDDKEIFYQIVREMKKNKEKQTAEEDGKQKRKKKFCTIL